MANNNDTDIKLNLITTGRGSIAETANTLDNLSSAVSEVGDSAGSAAGNLEDLNNEIAQNATAVEGLSDGYTNLVSNLQSIISEGGGATAVVAGLLAAITGLVTASAAVTKETADYAKEQSNLQKATGVSASLIAALSEGLRRNGGDAGDTADSLLQLGQVIRDAVADPAGQAAKNFNDLGISVVDSAGKARGIEEVFREIDKSAQGAGLSQDKLVTLAGVLGEDAAKKLLPLVGSFAALEDQVKATGLVLGEKTAQEAAKLTSGLSELEAMLKGVALQVGGEFLEAFNSSITEIKIAFESLKANPDFIEGVKALVATIKDFISTAGPDLVKVVQGLLQLLGGLGTVLGLIREGFASLKETIIGKTEATQAEIETTKLQAQAIGQATQAAAAQSAVIDGLKAKFEQLNTVQQANANLQKSLTDLRMQALTIAKERGLLSEEQFAQETLRIQLDSAKEQVKIAENLRKERERVALEEQKRLGQISAETKAQISALRQAEVRATIDLVKLQAEAQLKPILEANKKQIESISEITKAYKIEILKQTIAVDEAEKQQLITREQAAKKRLELALSVTQQEIKAIDEVLKNVKIVGDEREKLEKRRQDLVSESTKIEIEGSAKVRSAVIADIQAEIEALSKRRAKIEEENKALQEKRAIQIQAFEAAKKEFNAVADLADRSISAAAAIKGGFAQIVEQTDLASLSVEELQTRIDEINASANFIENFFAFAGKQNVVNDLRDTVTSLNQELINKTQRAQLEAEQERLAEKLEAEKQFNQEASQQLKESLAEQAEAQREHTKEINNLKQEIVENNNKLNADIAASEADTQSRIEEIFKQSREREAKERDKEAESIKDKRKKLAQELEEIDNQIASNKIKNEIDVANTRGNLNAELDKANANVASAKTTEEKQRALAVLAEVQAKIEDFNNKNKIREDAEKTKNDKISQAEKDLVKEKEAAKTDEEIAAAEERFNVKKSAAEKEFNDAVDAQNKILDLIKKGRTQEANEIKAKLAELQAINAKAETDRLKAIADNLARQKELRAKAEAERKAEVDKQVAEEKKRGEDEIKRLREQAQKREDELKSQIEKENKLFFKATEEREKKSAEAIANLSKDLGLASAQIADYVTNLAKSLGLAADKIKPIADAISQIKNDTNASGNTNNNNTGTSSTSSSSSNTNNNSSSSPVTSPTNNNNNAGSTSNTGSNSKGITRQPASGGKQPGIPTPGKFGGDSPGSVPTTANSASEYSKNMFAARQRFLDKADFNKNGLLKPTEKSIKAQEQFSKTWGDLTKSYGKDLDGQTLQLLLGKIGAVAQLQDSNPYKQAIAAVIDAVENAGKKTKGGSPTEDLGGSISGVDTPGGLSGSGVGGSGGKGNPNPTETQNPNVISPPPTEPKDTRFDPKKENIGEGAEADGFILGGPNFPTGSKPQGQATAPANVTASAQVQNALSINNLTVQVGAESLGNAVATAVMKLIQSGQLSRSLTDQVSSQMASDNFSRNPSRRLA